MKVHNDGTNWVLQECNGIKCNLIICPITDPEPTVEEVEAIYNSPRNIDVRAFKTLHFDCRALSNEIDKLDAESKDPTCTEANQALITTVMNTLQTKLDTKEAERITTMAEAVLEYGDGITTDFSNAIMDNLLGNI